MLADLHSRSGQSEGHGNNTGADCWQISWPSCYLSSWYTSAQAPGSRPQPASADPATIPCTALDICIHVIHSAFVTTLFEMISSLCTTYIYRCLDVINGDSDMKLQSQIKWKEHTAQCRFFVVALVSALVHVTADDSKAQLDISLKASNTHGRCSKHVLICYPGL